MKERSDTERLDWFNVNLGKVWVDEDMWRAQLGVTQPTFRDIREAIDAAMSASEAEELEEAWRWFRNDTRELCIVLVKTGKGIHDWEYRVGAESDFPSSPGRDQAILSAYRASKGKQ